MEQIRRAPNRLGCEFLHSRSQARDLGLPDPRESRQARHLTIDDSIAWADEKLLPNLSIKRRAHSATLRPTCPCTPWGST